MPYALLGLGFILLLLGSFGITGACFDRTKSIEARVGRLIRSFAGEALGIMCVVLAWNSGSRTQFTLGSVIVSIAVGSTVALFHTMMVNRNFGGDPSPVSSPSTDKD